VIAYYDISGIAGSSSWRTASLLAYSPRVPARAIALPATPQQTAALRSGQ
jgi:hypothetical protein